MNHTIFKEIDKPESNCGVFGIYNHPEASLMAYYGLFSMQHRGQEAAGITSFFYDEAKQKMKYANHRGPGLISEVFSNPAIFNNVLKGTAAIAHNRYSTTGSTVKTNIQPFNMIYKSGIMSLAHNGNLTNTIELRNKLLEDGTIFQTTTDSEIFMHLIAHSKKTTQLEQIIEALNIARGAFSLCILTNDSLIGARDPLGIRPLSIGKLSTPTGDSYVLASESCAFDIIGAEYIRTVEHNEIVVIDQDTVKTGEIKSYKINPVTPDKCKNCIFEYVYFARPDSKIFGENVDKVRRKLGKNLAAESPVIKDDDDKVNVVPVPDSSNTATLGYATENDRLNYPSKFELGLIRNHYVGRSFISPGQDAREIKVKTKINTVKGIMNGKHITIVDDSIVRGTTSKLLVKMIREAEPKSLDMRVTSPPVKFPCHYGMDFPSKEELIANHYENEVEIGKAIKVDSLKYLSIEKLIDSVPKGENIDYCTACFTGEYPIPIEDNSDKYSTES
ncbi:MAG: amidophosphoribosyltransferase [Ignavibacteria bacterium GWF2_33_9]|nr:MAG: amidophosphoribosyltransferase [Ignavibacteria bacterium GWF2_33_9]